MESLAAQIVETLIAHGYLVIFLIMVVEEAGIPLPIPGDGLLLLAGYLVSIGALSFPLCLLSIVGGALIGATVLYWVARRGGRRLFLRYGKYIRLREERLDQLSALFSRLGPFGTGISRLIPGLRIYTSALAGLALVPYPLFIFNVFWACTAWALVFVALGTVVGDHWRAYAHVSHQVTLYSAGAVALLIVAWLVLRRSRRRQQSQEPQQ